MVLHGGIKVDEPIHYKSTAAVNVEKYARLLKKIGENQPKVDGYLTILEQSGDFPGIYHLYPAFVDQEGVWTTNIDESHWRLIIAIHFLGINEDQNRYMSLSDELK
jgi:hypothetical protein